MLRTISKLFHAESVRLAASGQSECRFTQPGMAMPSRVTVKLLIDECLHSSLVELAHTAGDGADRVNYLGLGSSKD
ncbi:MAG: hypothetical protein ACYDCG_12715 [Candidatus Acidiferrales bacterium]